MDDRREELQEALDQIEMELWLDDYGAKYKRTHGSRGPQLNVKDCPCCGSSSWKVYIGRDTGLGNCFSGDCETKFNKWSFIKASLPSLSTRQLVEHIKDTARSHGWRPAAKASPAPVKAGRLELPESIELPHGGRNLKYLDDRSVDAGLARAYHLRYSHRGAFRYTSEGKSLQQDYSKRVIIPVFNLDAELVSFQGRDITGSADKKYLFPPGYASTGRYLYNGHNARGLPRVCVGEGAFDTIAIDRAFRLQRVGGVAALGTFGKHLSSAPEDSQLCELLKLRELGLKEVTFMWDAEPAAIGAAVDAAMLLRRYGLVCRVAILPADKDPNEVSPEVVVGAFWKAVRIDDLSASVLKMKCKVSS